MLTQDLPHNVKSSRQIYEYFVRTGLYSRFVADTNIAYQHGTFYLDHRQPLSDLRMHGVAVEYLCEDLY